MLHHTAWLTLRCMLSLQALADKKKGITDEDLLALVGDEVHQAAVVWELVDLQVRATRLYFALPALGLCSVYQGLLHLCRWRCLKLVVYSLGDTFQGVACANAVLCCTAGCVRYHGPAHMHSTAQGP